MTTRTGTTALRLGKTWRRASKSCASSGRAHSGRCGPAVLYVAVLYCSSWSHFLATCWVTGTASGAKLGAHSCAHHSGKQRPACLLAPPEQVLECWDRKRRDYVAVKIIRNIQVSAGQASWLGAGIVHCTPSLSSTPVSVLMRHQCVHAAACTCSLHHPSMSLVVCRSTPAEVPRRRHDRAGGAAHAGSQRPGRGAALRTPAGVV